MQPWAQHSRDLADVLPAEVKVEMMHRHKREEEGVILRPRLHFAVLQRRIKRSIEEHKRCIKKDFL